MHLKYSGPWLVTLVEVGGSGTTQQRTGDQKPVHQEKAQLVELPG